MNVMQVHNFDKVDDPVRTEEVIYNYFMANYSKISSSHSYVAMPIAWIINTYGLRTTQDIISKICSSNPHSKLFFVCQHILVSKLNFYGHLVFTPHATILDSYIPIPHYSCNYDVSFNRPWEDREYDFSFMGSYDTHEVRKRLKEAFTGSERVCFVDTGSWHFHSDDEKRKANKQKYIELLGNTKYSLCPRGTGPSTIRIWEAMAMGSHPLILSDYLKMPLERELNANLWTKKPESCNDFTINNEPYDNQKYWEYFSNESMQSCILKFL